MDLEVGLVNSMCFCCVFFPATQGDYDPSRTKVVHFSMNPTSLAKQQRKEEQQQLQEECERLRELVRVLKGGGSISGNLEGVGGFQSPQEVAGRLLAAGPGGCIYSSVLPEELSAEADGGIADCVLDGVVVWKMKAAGLVQEGVNVWWQSCGRGWVVRLNNNNSYHLFMMNEIPIQQPS